MVRRSISRQERQIYRITVLGLFITAALFPVPYLISDGTDTGDSLPWVLSSTALLVTLLYLATYARSLLRDLRGEVTRLNDFATSIAAGRRPHLDEVSTYGIRELDRLAGSITRMKVKADADIDRLKRLEQVKSEFLGNVSHELRTPIFTVQGFLETLLDGAVEDEDVRDEFLQKAHDNLLRLHSLLNDLIEISRIESGSMKMSFRYFDLADLCRGTIHNLSDKAAVNSISLSLEIDSSISDGKIQVYADRKRIEQAIVNLLDNAIKYNRPGGEVVVSLRPENGSVLVEVADDGPGIPAEHQDRIFERFYRVDRGRSRDIGGSGLGLAIVKHIVEAHGSKIEVTSDSRGGTRFFFHLPRQD